MESAVSRALGAEGIETLDIADFDEESLARLALKAGVEPSTLVLLRQSYALGRETELPAGVLFGMGREKMPLGLSALLVQDPARRRDAVKAALDDNHVPASLETDAARVLTRLDEMSVADALEAPAAPDRTNLGSLLASAKLPQAKPKKLAEAYVNHAGTNEEFWKTVEEEGVLTTSEVGRTQFTLQLAAATQNHAPMVAALQDRGIIELKGLATLDKTDWVDLIKGRGSDPAVGLPADLEAAGLDAEDYADLVVRVVEDALPTAMIAHRIDRFPQSDSLGAFFERNPDFDLRATPVRTYLASHPDALDFVETEDGRQSVAKGLKGLERAYRIAPSGTRIETMEALLAEGFDSAQKIRTVGRAAFVRRFEGTLGRPRAEKVFARANNASAVATMVVARHSAVFDRTPIHVLPRRVEKISKLPSYEELFGSLDFCSCEHCRSVFGPATYLVDILHWLDHRPSAETETSALDVLLDGRRADLGAIELSCTNTSTPLPTIDLVNEVLEVAVAPVPSGDTVSAFETTSDAADLRAHPEHLHRAAYEVLAGVQAGDPEGRDAIYPFNLPFNLWLEEARTYLGRLGVPRYRLMEVLQGEDRARTDTAVAAETFGMSPLEWAIIAGEPLDPARTVAGFWGLPDDADVVDAFDRVSVLLERATPPIAENAMEFDELADLLRTDFVQEPAEIGVWFDGAACDTTRAELTGLTGATLDRIHRFLRLRRRLGWSAADLDRAVLVLGGGALDEDCLVRISHVRRLATRLHQPAAELLTWWGPLDTRRWESRLRRGVPPGAPPGGEGQGLVFDDQLEERPEAGDDASPYDRLFQAMSTSAEPNEVFGVSSTGAELADETHDLADHLPAIAGALGVTGEELAELVPRLPDGTLSLSNLSVLYRHVSLARALDVGIRDLVALLGLTGLDPFDASRTEDALAFLDEVDAVRASRLSVAEIDYLLRHRDTRPATLDPDHVEIGVLLYELGNALRTIEVDHPLPDASATVDVLRERLAAALETALGSGDAAGVLALVDLEAETAPPSGAEALVEGPLARIFDPSDARKKLVEQGDAEYLDDRRDRLEYALAGTLAHLRRSATASAVIERLSSAIALDPAMAAPLLRTHLRHPDSSGRPLMAVFSDAAVRDHEVIEPSGEPVLPGPAELPDQFAAYRRLYKAALLLNRLRIRKEELTWILRQGPARGMLDLQELPVAPNEDPASYAAWARLRDAVVLRDRFPTAELFDLLQGAADARVDGAPGAIAAAHESLLTELARRSRWDATDLEFLVGTPARGGTAAIAGALGFTYPADWSDERPLKRLAEVLVIVRRVGMPAETLWPWREIPRPAEGSPEAREVAAEEQAAQADEIKQAVRAHHEGSAWHEVARSLRDGLRERQRDALVGWLVGNDPRFADAQGLFEHFLLDVEMGPCQLTSRIKQAISSVQLFVQRALMGLETDVVGTPLIELSKADSEEWDAMKSYRVWEANRKVFLYPENWIEPALRDDKTPFFRELEDELLQSELNAESAERAVRGYLEKLDEVARLEVVGLVQRQDSGSDVLHVFGRTRGAPPRYFHRKRIDGSRWTPWEKVEVDIEGDHLIPVVFNRRLYLFWPVITEAAIEEPQTIPSANSAGDQPDPPKRYYQIRLAWSQQGNGGWSRKKMAGRFIGDDVDRRGQVPTDIGRTTVSSPADFFFRAYEEGGDLIIEGIRSYRSLAVTFAMKDGDVPIDVPDFDDDGDGSDSDGDPDTPSVPTGSYRTPRFRMSGCDGTVTLEGRGSRAAVVYAPSGMVPANQTFARARGSAGMRLPVPASSGGGNEPVLDGGPRPFEIVPLRLDDFQSRGPFFYQDRRRTFLVDPRTFSLPWIRRAPDWLVGGTMALDLTSNLPERAPRPELPAPDPWVYDPAAVATLPDRISVAATAVAPPTPGTGPGLTALSREALAATFGSRVAFIAGEPVQPASRRLALEVRARVVNADGRTLAGARTGHPPVAAGALADVLVDRTILLPPLVVDDPVIIPPPLKPSTRTRYRFESFYHPYLCTMMRELNRFGLEGVLDPDPFGPEPLLRRQVKEDAFFSAEYEPRAVSSPLPKDAFDFAYGGAYAIYNWEVFFHVPFLIACRLSEDQRFAEARRWFHYVFDPTETDGDAPQRFWKVKPLFDLFLGEDDSAGPIHELLLLLQYDGSDPEKLRERDELIDQVAEWRANPFSPHALARLRLGVYARAVVMKYIDNLIAWGDQLFRRDTMESVNEATQLYVLAAQILGRRPRRVDVEPPEPRSFNDLRGELDAFSNTIVEEVEGLLPEVTDNEADIYEDDVPLLGPTLFFCVPPNEKLLADYWDRVADRLFKIRNCLSIEGVVRQLPLFEPPIDPALLVRARAAGVDLASALSDVSAPFPLYRYQVLVQQATELCGDVRGLGQSLLSALEKKDAEALALLRAGHEVRLQNAILDVREKQVREARETLESLLRSRENAEIRRDYYRSRTFMNAAETAQFGLSAAAGLLDATAQGIRAVGSILSGVPDNEIGGAGFGGSPIVTFSVGGTQFSLSATAASESLRINAAIADRLGQLSGLIGSHQRRQDDWDMLGDTAEKEIEGLDRQIAAAEIRLAIAERERANLGLQLEQTGQTEAFLRDKYTNGQLYQWMVGQLSSVYFQSYQLAYDMARRAERAWQVELGVTDKRFIQFGYWDSLKKGLLAGERLHHDIKRMEVAYLETNKREYELTRHVSLLELDPLALLSLRREGKCLVAIPESWFDLDSPGHYMRRIKSVAVSIPSVTGPYTPARCTLTLLRSSVRTVPSLDTDYARQGADDSRFVDDFGPIQSIVTSSGNNDSGLFETNLRDERYLPFENAGVMSEWQLKLPANPANGDLSQFDYDTISDVILHIRYTAREGGEPLRRGAVDHVKEQIDRAEAAGTVRLFSARHDFPNAWARFQGQSPGPEERFEMVLELREEHYPFWSQGRLNSVSRVDILARSTESPLPSSMEVFDTVATDDPGAKRDTLTRDAVVKDLLAGELTGGATGIPLPLEPVGEIRFAFETQELSDVWVAIAWSSSS